MKNFAMVTTIYVSNEIGNDDNAGISFVENGDGYGPVKSLERAIRFVSGMRVSGYMQPVVIKLMDDVYTLEKPLDIGEYNEYLFNGGAKAYDVTIESFNENKRTLISGGKKITSFKPDIFNGVECLSAFIPEVKDGKWDFDDLYVDGVPAAHTRYPDSGYLMPEEVEKDYETFGLRVSSKWFIAKEGDIKSDIANLEKVKIRCSHFWLSEILPIESYDAETRKCTFTVPTRFGVSAKEGTAASMHYYLEDVPFGFKNKGEWYLDKTAGMLYYIPLDGQVAESIDVYAPFVDELINFTGYLNGENVRGVTLNNLSFAYTNSKHQSYFEKYDSDGAVIESYPVGCDLQAAVQLRGAINFNKATACAIKNCEIYCVGTYGVRVRGDSDHVDIVDCDIHDCLGGGVNAGEWRPVNKDRYVNDLTIKNCRMYNLGIRHLSSIGVLITKGYNCTIKHNDIHDLEYSGISLGWSWGFQDTFLENNKICFNKIYNIGKGNLSDMGGIYIVGKQKGTVVSNNIVHDVIGRNYGAIGLYADEGCYSTIFEKNIVYNVKDCFHIHFGAFNVVKNNIFAFPERGAVTMGKAIPFVKFIAERNIIYLNPNTGAYLGWRGEKRLPSETSMFSDYNLIYCTDGSTPKFSNFNDNIISFEDGMRSTGWDGNSIFEDPMFKGASMFDFTLDENSPATKIGFEKIDISSIGCKR